MSLVADNEEEENAIENVADVADNVVEIREDPERSWTLKIVEAQILGACDIFCSFHLQFFFESLANSL